MPTILRSTLTALACVTVLAIASPAMAAMVNIKTDLKGANEVPPNDSKGVGSVTTTYDTTNKKLTWKGSYSGLSGPATGAHFHAAEKSTMNGAVQVPIAPATSPFEGSATLTDAQAADLMAGRFYVNVHTAKNPGGEIRGQLTK